MAQKPITMAVIVEMNFVDFGAWRAPPEGLFDPAQGGWIEEVRWGLDPDKDGRRQVGHAQIIRRPNRSISIKQTPDETRMGYTLRDHDGNVFIIGDWTLFNTHEDRMEAKILGDVVRRHFAEDAT